MPIQREIVRLLANLPTTWFNPTGIGEYFGICKFCICICIFLCIWWFNSTRNGKQQRFCNAHLTQSQISIAMQVVLFWLKCNLKNLKFQSKETLKVSPVLVVLSRTWSPLESSTSRPLFPDLSSHQASYIQCFNCQAGRGVFAGYCTGIAFINQAITKNSQIHRTNNYRGFHIQNSATSSGCITLSHKFHSITSAGHPAYSRTASRSRLALVINIFLPRTLQHVMRW